MEVKPGYKLTEIGVIPEDWGVQKLGALLRRPPSYGINAPAVPFSFRLPAYLRITDITEDGRFDHTAKASVSRPDVADYQLVPGDIVVARTGASVGKSYLYDFRDGDLAFAGFLIRVSPDPERLVPAFLSFYMQSPSYWVWIQANSMRSGQPGVNAKQYAALLLPLPPTREQEAIVGALGDADALIDSLKQLLAKKRDIKAGAMEELLTGKRRLPGFNGLWKSRPIGEIANSITERNTAGRALPVLTCSKRLGFVDSLHFFKNQVFSDDLSTYKIIRRDQIGYPANHVEEGSIGLQDLHDAAVVSPIYVVFSTVDDVDSYFLHRLLKLDTYRWRFATETSSSVDRRGSLRWPTFSQIDVTLPEIDEQRAISDALRAFEREIAALEDKLDKARAIKKGMMQQLLTGRIRLV